MSPQPAIYPRGVIAAWGKRPLRLRVEGAGDAPSRAQAATIQRVLDTLAKHGVELTDDGGVRPTPKRRGNL
jgi:hypothetical protein